MNNTGISEEVVDPVILRIMWRFPLYKSLLLHFPWLYENIQSYRDVRIHRDSVQGGSFAQHGEDIEIMRLLRTSKATGPYVDVGCNHPFKLSNTYLLYLNGWRGLCIDPLSRFTSLYEKWRPDDVFECLGISDHPGAMPLFEFESDVLTTLDQHLAEEYQRQGHKFRRKTQVEIRSIDSVLEARGVSAPLSLLSLDIEGYELPALRSITLEKWRPALICLEVLTANGRRNEESIHHLIGNGYRIESDLGLNLLFQRAAG
jgi:FkbM family methyltransferase